MDLSEVNEVLAVALSETSLEGVHLGKLIIDFLSCNRNGLRIVDSGSESSEEEGLVKSNAHGVLEVESFIL